MEQQLTKLIKGCFNRDESQQRLLYNQHKGFACKVVFRYIYRYEKALDVVTDGFIKVFNHFEKFKCTDPENQEKQLMGWIRKIMINCAIDELRKTDMIIEIGQIHEEVWNIDSRSDDADQQLLYKDLVKEIKELPTQYRVIFGLYVLDGYTHTEIADLMKISVSTSRSTLTRARAMLREKIIKMESKSCLI